MLKILSFGISDIGLKRSNNEDAYFIKPEAGFMTVADGMGGAAAGEIASQIFMETASEIFAGTGNQSEQETIQLVQKIFQTANEKIFVNARENPKHKGMGCTAEMLVFYNQSYVIGHIGDSRTYLLRKGTLRQLTRDHSLVQDQIEQGIITSDQARKHPLKNIILRSVGVHETLALDLVKGMAASGDLFLLCSDGLTDMVEDDSIKRVLSFSLSLAQKGEKLIDLAKSAGGYDNITVVLGEVL